MLLKKALPFLALTIFISSCQRSPDTKVLASIGDDEIRVGDFKETFREHSEDYSSAVLHDSEGGFIVRKNILNGLIEETLLLQVAREKNISFTSEEKEEIKKKSQVGFQSGELEGLLDSRKISLDDWLEKQQQRRTVDKLLEQEIYSHIKLTSEETRSFYKRNRSLFREPDRVHCRHIVTNKKEKGDTILSLLAKGENFAAVAQKYSESPDRENGGDLGYIAYGEYPVIFNQACFTLNTGQTSGVVASEYGYHIFRVIDKKPGRQLSFDEALPRIEKMLRERKGRESLGPWVEALHKDRTIVIDEKLLKNITLPLPPKQEEEEQPETAPHEGDHS